MFLSDLNHSAKPLGFLPLKPVVTPSPASSNGLTFPEIYAGVESTRGRLGAKEVTRFGFWFWAAKQRKSAPHEWRRQVDGV